MNYSSQFVKEACESPVVYTNMSFGSLGQDALHYGYLKPNTRLPHPATHAYNPNDDDWNFDEQHRIVDYGVTLEEPFTICYPEMRGLGNWPYPYEDFNVEAIFGEDELDEVPPSTKTENIIASMGQTEEYNDVDVDWLLLGASTDASSSTQIDSYCPGTLRRAKHGMTKVTARNYTASSSGIQKKQRRGSRQPFKKCPNSVKGLTMCLRTFVRQLLAGTGWIAPGNIRKDQALDLINILVGQEIASSVPLDLPTRKAPPLSEAWKEMYYTAVLAEVVSKHCGVALKSVEVAPCFRLSHGSYHLSANFMTVLGEREWPPCVPNEQILRAFGCYRQGESWMKKQARKMSMHY